MRSEMVGRNVVHAWRQYATTVDRSPLRPKDRYSDYYICRNVDGGFDIGCSRGLIKHGRSISFLLMTVDQVDNFAADPACRFVVWLRFLRANLHAGTKLKSLKWPFLWDEVEGGVDWGS